MHACGNEGVTVDVIIVSSGDFTLPGFNFVFRNSSTVLATDYVFGLCGVAVDDQEKGFILYFDFDQSAIHPDDYSRLQIGNAAILITITDNIREYTQYCLFMVFVLVQTSGLV